MADGTAYAGRDRTDLGGGDLLLLVVSTRRMGRRMGKLVQSLGITSLSKSQVSRMTADMDAQVGMFRTRRLDDAGPFTFVAADAFTMKSAKPAG